MLTTQYINIDGINYAYVDEGNKDKPAVLLLHGFPDSKELWFNFIPKLVEQGYRVIAPDLKGYGDTDIPDNFDIHSSSKDLFNLLTQLDVKQAHVIGHDWGAFLGWLFTHDYPTIVKSYVAMSVGHPNGYLRYGGVSQVLKGMYVPLFLIKNVAEKALSAFDYKMLEFMDESGTLHDNWKRRLSRPNRLTAALNWYRRNYMMLMRGFGGVNVPTLGLIGEKDPALTVDQMAASWHYVSNHFDYQVVQDAGHWLQITHQDEVLNHIIQFYKDRT